MEPTDDHRLNALVAIDDAREGLSNPNDHSAAAIYAAIAQAEATYAVWEILVEIRGALRDIRDK